MYNKFFNRYFCVASLQNGDFREQSKIRTSGSARRRCGAALRSADRVSQVLQAQGAPVQVTKATAKRDKVAAKGG